MFKLVRRLLLIPVLLVVAAVAALFWSDSLLKKGVEAGGSAALGVRTTVGKASLGLLSGHISLSGLSVANPTGFKPSPLLDVPEASAKVSFGSVLKSVIEVPLLEIRGARLRIEQGPGGSNVGAVMDYMKGRPGSGGSDGKKLVIRTLRILDTTVTAEVGALGQTVASKEITIPKIEVENVGEGGGGAVVAEVAATVMRALLDSVARNGAGILPADLTTDIGTRLQGILGSGRIKALDGIPADANPAGRVVEGLRDVLGGKKKP